MTYQSQERERKRLRAQLAKQTPAQVKADWDASVLKVMMEFWVPELVRKQLESASQRPQPPAENSP